MMAKLRKQLGKACLSRPIWFCKRFIVLLTTGNFNAFAVISLQNRQLETRAYTAVLEREGEAILRYLEILPSSSSFPVCFSPCSVHPWNPAEYSIQEFKACMLLLLQSSSWDCFYFFIKYFNAYIFNLL